MIFLGGVSSSGLWCCRWPCRLMCWLMCIPTSCSLSARCRASCANSSGGARRTTGFPRDYWFPEVRSLAGAVTMFIFVLYPYVYLLTRTAFAERAGGMLEASRSLGLGPWRSFFRLSLPLARPAVAAGTTLALMETLADYGTVSYFGVQTFTTGIYRAWFSLGDRIAAARSAIALQQPSWRRHCSLSSSCCCWSNTLHVVVRVFTTPADAGTRSPVGVCRAGAAGWPW